MKSLYFGSVVILPIFSPPSQGLLAINLAESSEG